MKLSELIKKGVLHELAIAKAAIPAITNKQQEDSLAEIAGIALALSPLETLDNKEQGLKTTLEDLLKMHPQIIEGCMLTDILSKADPLNDYEDLRSIQTLTLLARNLVQIGEIKPIVKI